MTYHNNSIAKTVKCQTKNTKKFVKNAILPKKSAFFTVQVFFARTEGIFPCKKVILTAGKSKRGHQSRMRTNVRNVLLSLAIALTLSAVTLLVIFRFVLPTRARSNTVLPAYTIGEWDGKVAVFEGDDTYPMQIFDTDVAGLPDEQRAQVEKGVAVLRAEELYQMLEDYTG